MCESENAEEKAHRVDGNMPPYLSRAHGYKTKTSAPSENVAFEYFQFLCSQQPWEAA